MQDTKVSEKVSRYFVADIFFEMYLDIQGVPTFTPNIYKVSLKDINWLKSYSIV